MKKKEKIETEYKLELTKEEFDRCNNLLKEKACLLMSSELEDYFFNVKKFDEKGYDFTRIRVYNNEKYEKTDKIWKLVEGQRIRTEKEEIISKLDFVEILKNQENPIVLKKHRIDFRLYIKPLNQISTVSLDKLFLKDQTTRYFIETEIDVIEEKSSSMRPKLRDWMFDFFSLSERPEGTGMFKLALSSQKTEKT